MFDPKFEFEPSPWTEDTSCPWGHFLRTPGRSFLPPLHGNLQLPPSHHTTSNCHPMAATTIWHHPPCIFSSASPLLASVTAIAATFTWQAMGGLPSAPCITATFHGRIRADRLPHYNFQPNQTSEMKSALNSDQTWVFRH